MSKCLRLVLGSMLACTLHFSASAQNLAINNDGSTANASAILDAKSTSKGVLIPRMSKTEKNAIPFPATGLLVFQETPDSIGFHYYNGTAWVWLANSSSSVSWLTTGNSGTDSVINFLGTLDDKPLMLRQNNKWMGQLNSKTHNYFIGGGAGFNNTIARQNVALGDSALFNNTTAGGNTAVGYRSMAGSAATTGGLNVAVGNNTLSSITTGGQNIAIGDNAMTSMKTGSTNVLIGAGAMEAATAGVGNIGMGLWALRGNDSGYHNIALGTSALYYNDSSRNIGIGYQTLAYNNRNNNMGIGYEAGFLNNYLQTDESLGIENTYLGFQSGYYANTGSYNVAVGNGALVGSGYFNGDVPGNTFYKRNVSIGDSSMANSYGSDNVAVGYKALQNSSNSSQHVAVGSRALFNTTSTYPNTAVGYSSQDSSATGGANTSLGSLSLTKNKAGYNNTAIGNAAMFEATGVQLIDNTAVGNDALRLTRYYGQSAFGAGALRNDTSGLYNTAVGYLSMYNHIRGNSNTAVGTSALRSDTAGYVNTAIGVNSMFNHKIGDNNVAVGIETLFSDVDGGANTAIGGYAMHSHKTSGVNTAVGYESMYYDTAGSFNATIGYRALRYTKNGFENTALGVGAIEYTDSSYYNTAVGRGAMFQKGGTYNTAVGYYAAGEGPGVSTTKNYTIGTTNIGAFAGFRTIANENTFVGYYSGYGGGADTLKGIENTGLGSYTLTYTTTGKSNTAAGLSALYNNSTGSANVAVGTRAGLNNTTASYNSALGDSALYNSNTSENAAFGYKALFGHNTVSGSSWNNAFGSRAGENLASGTQNVLMGSWTFLAHTAGSLNTALGNAAMSNGTGGNQNTAVGAYALIGTTTSGNNNTGIGYNTGISNTSGTNNTFLGAGADASSGTFTNATAVGYNASVGASNSLVLGNGANVGIGTSTPTTKLHVKTGTSSATLNASSDETFESNVTSYVELAAPDAAETGILSSNTAGIRSAVIFASNNSMQLRTGGNTNRLYINNTGYTGVNRTPTTGSSVGTFQIQNIGASDDILALYNSSTGNRWSFYVSSDMNLYYNGTVKGTFANATGNYTSVSDIRYKKDIAPYSYGIDAVKALTPYKYHYLDNTNTDPYTVGFMAQDLLKIYPEAVHNNIDKQGNQFYTVDYQTFSVLSIKAIQEQEVTIEKLAKENEELKKKNEGLEKDVQLIKAKLGM